VVVQMGQVTPDVPVKSHCVKPPLPPKALNQQEEQWQMPLPSLNDVVDA
jgi:hypothetical protein